MTEELRDPELSVKPGLHKAYFATAYHHDMVTEKRNALTAYVLRRIAELDATYGATAEALRRGGLPKNAAARLRSGGDTVGISAAKEAAWARALGMSVEELHAAAFVHSQATSARPLTAAHREAIERAKPLGQMTDAEAEVIIRSAPQFWDRPADWWTIVLLTEYKHVRDVREREAHDERNAARGERKNEAYRAAVRAEMDRLNEPVHPRPVRRRRIA